MPNRFHPDRHESRLDERRIPPQTGGQMGLGVSIFLIAVGAILTWAVNASVSGLELNTIGVILMVVGALGLVLSMIFWSSWGGFGETRRRATYVDEGPRY
jgi:hypothetical protein